MSRVVELGLTEYEHAVDGQVAAYLFHCLGRQRVCKIHTITFRAEGRVQGRKVQSRRGHCCVKGLEGSSDFTAEWKIQHNVILEDVGLSSCTPLFTEV
jgi:hypothetical protein